MNKRIVLLAFVFILLSLIPLKGTEREEDALCIWSTTVIKKSSGFDIKLTDCLTFSPHYNCQAYHNYRTIYNRRSYDDHVIYFTFTVKL